MQRYVLAVRDRAITAESTDTTLVRTSRGVDEIAIRFYSPEWLEGFALSCALYVGDVLEEQALTLTETTESEWLAEAVIAVPDSVLESAGALGVTVHGVTSGNEHIITEQSFPLTVMQEGDGEGMPVMPFEIDQLNTPTDTTISRTQDGGTVIEFDHDGIISCPGIVIDTGGTNMLLSSTSNIRWQVGTSSDGGTLPTIITRGWYRQSYNHNITLDGYQVTPGEYNVFAGVVGGVSTGGHVTLEINTA